MKTNSNSKNSSEQLKKYIEGIENYEADKKEINDSIKEIYEAAKSAGFDPKIMRQIIRIRKMDKSKLEEQELLLETYKTALGMDN